MKIIFVLNDGTEKSVSFKEGQTILQVAEKNEIPVHSACDGFGVCGCCNILVENLHDQLPPLSENEEDGLDKSQIVTMQSRLACQVVLNNNLDGLRIKLH